ncbi:MAG: XdhC family protein [Rhodanobacteraceae bacterium]
MAKSTNEADPIEPAPIEADPIEPAAIGGRHAIAEAVQRLAREGRDAALAVVVSTRGSTYRKPGAQILLDAHGVRVGALSGGCLEAELEEFAREMLAAGRARQIRFDTRDDGDRLFGSGSGCRGTMQVLLLPLPAHASPLRDALVSSCDAGLALTLRLSTEGDHIGGGEALVGEQTYRFDANGHAHIGDLDSAALTELILPRAPHLLLLGAGPETPPLMRMARMLGWRVDVAEHRERWSAYGRKPEPDRLHTQGLAALPALLAAHEFDAALVMNHHADLDVRCLRDLAASEVEYVGLLGPPARRDALLTEIGEPLAQHLRSRLHAPVGLDLGGEGPDAIALAIVAELHRHLAGRSCG